MNSDILSLFPLSATCDEQGHLCLAGHRASALAQHTGTPLYLYDADTIQHQVADLHGALKAAYPADAELPTRPKPIFRWAWPVAWRPWD